jgi:hypothetical protein
MEEINLWEIRVPWKQNTNTPRAIVPEVGAVIYCRREMKARIFASEGEAN